MGNVEFEIGDGSSSDAAGDRPRAERQQSTLPWFVLLAVLLIGAGSGLAQQTELPAFAEEENEVHFLSQNDDGGVITWSWRGDQILDHRTITRVGAALAPATDVPEWSCLDADEPDAPPAPYPDAPGGIFCTGLSCFDDVEGSADDRPGCSTTTIWLPPEGWERPTDSTTAAD